MDFEWLPIIFCLPTGRTNYRQNLLFILRMNYGISGYGTSFIWRKYMKQCFVVESWLKLFQFLHALRIDKRLLWARLFTQVSDRRRDNEPFWWSPICMRGLGESIKGGSCLSLSIAITSTTAFKSFWFESDELPWKEFAGMWQIFV